VRSNTGFKLSGIAADVRQIGTSLDGEDSGGGLMSAQWLTSLGEEEDTRRKLGPREKKSVPLANSAPCSSGSFAHVGLATGPRE